MSRHRKRGKKKQQRKVFAMMAAGIAVAVLLVASPMFFGGGGEESSPDPDGHTEVSVSFSHGDGTQMENHSAGDITKDEDHSLPPYLEDYLGGKKDNKPFGDPHGGSGGNDSLGEGKSPEAGKVTGGSVDEASKYSKEGYLTVHFIDIGQGDASLIMFVDTNPENGDDSAAMLVDAGDGSHGTSVRSYLKEQGVEELSYFVCTHPDADHIGGAASVVSNVRVSSGKVFGPDYEKSTKTYENLKNEIFHKSMSYEEPVYGKEYSLGLATFVFVAPLEDHEDVNSNSLVFKLWYGEDSFLFVGDCEEEEEAEIVNGDYAKFVDADVLKVGHHGSKTSSSSAFLSLVSPKYAVISCGRGNSYYHPHKTALDRLKDSGASLYRTDKQGSIVAVTYGQGILFDKDPCNDWSPGGE